MRILDLTSSELDVEAKFTGLNNKLDSMNQVLAGLYPTVPSEDWITASGELGQRYIRSFKGTLQSLELEFARDSFTDFGTVKLTDFVTGYNDSGFFGCKAKWTDISTGGGGACKLAVGLLTPSTVCFFIIYGANSMGRFRKVKINGMPVDFKYS